MRSLKVKNSIMPNLNYAISMQAVLFVENIKNVTRFSEIMSIFSGELSSMAKVTVFLANKQVFRDLMNGLESNVDESLYHVTDYSIWIVYDF